MQSGSLFDAEKKKRSRCSVAQRERLSSHPRCTHPDPIGVTALAILSENDPIGVTISSYRYGMTDRNPAPPASTGERHTDRTAILLGWDNLRHSDRIGHRRYTPIG